MKGVAIFIFCFISVSAGLKCYECFDVSPGQSTNCSSDAAVKVCGEGSTFCVTATIKSGYGPYSGCGERNCVIKGCMDSEYCPEPGTFEVEESYGNFTLDCCSGDLCNTFSSAHVCKENLLIVCITLLTLFCFAS